MVKFQVVNSELKIFIEKAKQKMEIKSIILFGSRARGDHTQGSDFDLIFVGDFKDNFIKRPLNLLKLNESKYNYELFCYTEEEFEKMFRYGNALLLDALDEGVPLVGKDFFDTYKKQFNAMIEQGLKRSRCTWILPIT